MSKQAIFPYKRAFILGLAKSGTAALNVLLNGNVDVRVLDDNVQETDDIVNTLRKKGAEVVFYTENDAILDGIDVVVKNPGIRYDHEIVRRAQAKNIPIITEVELAQQLAKNNDMIGVTGSNGKTTTTSLIAEMLTKSHVNVRLAGNIGVVACEEAETLRDDETLLLELSSFQLMGTPNLKPRIAVLLNLYEAHLDYHGSLSAYIEAKTTLFKSQDESDFLVYNADDARVVEQIAHASAKLVPFSTKTRQDDGAWMDEQYIYFRDEKIITHDDIVLVGDHNKENILAAICASMISGAKKETIRQVLRTFSGVKHRLQFVKNVHGRSFYNDSKATNMLATKKALASFTQPTILLAGGLDRGNEFDELIPALTNVKACVLFGETAEELAKTAQQANITETYIVRDVEEATKKAYDISETGDVILLSPACASWDQYKTFEERGEIFVRTVHILA